MGYAAKKSFKEFKKKPLVAASVLMPILMFGSTVTHAALEEIIVTANKRAESANDIGLSISAVSGEKLAEQKLTSLEEITTAVPGLVFATSQQGTPILTLRGVGFNESSLGVYPATSLYVDEIPLPFPAMAAHSAYDLERAEVLKGPQGVLFGQNSTGGAINFIAAKPTEEFSYGGDVSYGSYNKVEVNGFVSGALSDTVSGRLAFQTAHADEWQDSLTSNEENGKEDYTAMRMALRFEPSDTAEINVNINGWTDKSDPQALQYVAATPKRFDQAPGQAAALFALPLTKKDAESADWSDIDEPSGDKEFMQYSVRGDFELNDSMTLTALAAYSDYEQEQSVDGDGHNLVSAGYIFNKGDVDSTFLEVRLSGDEDSFRWVVGANYEDSSTSEDQLLQLNDNTTTRPQTLFVHRTGSLLEQEIESYAFFGNIEYDLAEDLTLKVGARYTDTEIEADVCNWAPENADGFGPGSNTATLFNALPAISAGILGVPVPAFDPIGVNDCFTLNAAPLELGVPGFPYQDTLAEDNVSWRLGLDFQATEDALVYANISQGYKAGSFPNIPGNDFSQQQPVTEESVLAYELGFKATMADGSVQWNGAIFHYDYEDKQVRGKVDIALFGPLDRLVNIPESTITGVETDIVAQLTDELTLTASVTDLNSEVDKYPMTLNGVPYAFDAYGVNRDLSGEDLPFTPELSYSLDLDYRTSLEQGGTLFMGVNVVGQSDSDAVFDGDDLTIEGTIPRGVPAVTGVDAGFHKSITDNYFVIEDYFTVGARIGYESDDGHLRVMLWGKNITDEYYWNSVIASSEGAGRSAGRPRTYGITVGYKY
ncbi:MAG: TonB-dependent receptor [Porticoccaceae bacterium]